MSRRFLLGAGTTQPVPFLDRLDAVKAAGFDGVSMFAADYDATIKAGFTAEDIRSRVADAGLIISEVEIVGNWLPGDSRKPDMPGWLRDAMIRMSADRVIDVAVAVGAQGITVGELLDVDCPLDVAAERFAEVCAKARERGLYVALEFIPTGRIATLMDGWTVVRDAGAANGGLLVDSWHLFRSGSSLDLLASLPASAITSVQIGDAPAEPEPDLDHAMSHDRLLPGEGAFDLAGFMAAVERTGTSAPLSVEVFSDELGRRPMEEIARRCAETGRKFMQGNNR